MTNPSVVSQSDAAAPADKPAKPESNDAGGSHLQSALTLSPADLSIVRQQRLIPTSMSVPLPGLELSASGATVSAEAGVGGDLRHPQLTVDQKVPDMGGIVIIGDPYTRMFNDLRGAVARWQVPDVSSLSIEPNNQAVEYSHMGAALHESGGALVRFPDGSILNSPPADALAERLGLHVHPDKKAYDVVVVGAGPGGLSAGINGAAEGLNTLVIGGDNIGGQAGLSSLIENLPGHINGISGPDLTRRNLDQAQRLGAEVLVHNWATDMTVDPTTGNKVIKLSDGREVEAKAVVLATGLQPRVLKGKDGEPIPGVDEYTGRAVFYGCGPEQTDPQVVTGKKITIIGGANSAGQAAVNLAENGAKSVDIAVRDPSGISTSMSAYLIEKIDKINADARARGEGDVIHIHAGTALDEKNGLVIDSDKDRMKGLNVIQNGKPGQIEADRLLVFIGSEPPADFPQMARDKKGYALTGSDLGDQWKESRPPLQYETSMPGVFAIGDGEHNQALRVGVAMGQGQSVIKNVFKYEDARKNDGKPATAEAGLPADRTAVAPVTRPSAALKDASLVAEGAPPVPEQRPGTENELLNRALAGDADATRQIVASLSADRTVANAPATFDQFMEAYRQLPPEKRAAFQRELSEGRGMSKSSMGALLGGTALVAAVLGAAAYAETNHLVAAAGRQNGGGFVFTADDRH